VWISEIAPETKNSPWGCREAAHPTPRPEVAETALGSRMPGTCRGVKYMHLAVRDKLKKEGCGQAGHGSPPGMDSHAAEGSAASISVGL